MAEATPNYSEQPQFYQDSDYASTLGLKEEG